MSRYQLTPVNPAHDVIVGRNPQMNTLFFAHNIDVSEDEDDERRDLLWVGCWYEECRSIDTLVASVKPYVIMTPQEEAALIRRLTEDSLTNRSEQRGGCWDWLPALTRNQQ